jgi:type I restriction enzyme S subunit
MKDLGRYHLTTNLNKIEDRISGAFAKDKRLVPIKAGAILIPRSGSVALNHRAILGVDAVIVSHICALVPNADLIDNRCLYYYLCTITMEKITKKTTGLDAINFSDLRQIQVPLPPLDEQRRIAAILDKADAIRRKRQQALTLADEFLRSTFLEMFGNPVVNSRGWKTSPLTDVLSFRTGKLDSNAAEGDGIYPFFTCAKEDFSINSYAFDCEALILAGNNANAEYSVKHYCGKFNAYQRTYIITLDGERHSYPYFKMVLESFLTELKRFSKGTNTKYLTMGIFNEMHVPVPPTRTQLQFDQIYNRTLDNKAKFDCSLQVSDDLFASLSQRAFQGEL